MFALFRFLWRYYPFFLFLILEIVALSMVVVAPYQQTVAYALFSGWSGAYFQKRQEVGAYFYLRKDNEALQVENTMLKTEIGRLQLMQQTSAHFLSADSLLMYKYVDSLEIVDSSRKHFEYMACQLVSNQTHKARNYLMINKGKADGIRPKMGVVNTHGVVGIVSKVSTHFSTLISLLNTDLQFSALVEPSGELCSLHWEAEDVQTAKLLHLEPSAQIAVGDTVITSGYSHIFPKGISLGVVSDIQNTNSEFNVWVKLSVDFSRIHHVNVLSNPYEQELRDLESKEVSQ